MHDAGAATTTEKSAARHAWREAGGCLDYRNFILDLPRHLPTQVYDRLDRRLRTLGRLEQELLGVPYIRTDWGVLIVPPPGFPEIKMKVRHHIGEDQIRRLLAQVHAIVEGALAAKPPEEERTHD